MWRTWRPKFGWTILCPIKFADCVGVVVIMPRAEQPVTVEEFQAADPDDYPDITSEWWKVEDFGRIEGRTVALDYGLADADAVQERRAYYVRMVRPS